MWDEDSSGGLLPAVIIIPRGEAELWVETRISLGGGQIYGASEGPLTPNTEGNVPVAITLPSEISSRLARVTVLVTAIHPETGRAMAHAAARAMAYREASGEVVLLRDEEAEALAVGEGVIQDGYVEMGLVGREVTP